MRNWLFWDEAVLAEKDRSELAAHLQALRRGGERREVVRLAVRFVERAKGADTIHLFTREEIAAALAQIEGSSRARQFVDPIRLRMYKRFLGQEGG
ncbi:MAG: hypothetical protein M0Z27_11915 [Thermaerobacter sp.]|jgi:hypothetical protein|nr:hypothetical protein [Thermaerobacter sp.]MDA8146750.1 hypothetical protein [Thermaerobacter sp.]